MMVWSLALCPDDTKQDSVVYGAEFGVVFLAKGPRTASIQEGLDCLRDSAPCLSRAATLPKATKLEFGRGAHLKTPSSANHTAAASQPSGRIAKAASCLHLFRVSPGPTPAGKTLPHSYPETRFRRERARDNAHYWSHRRWDIMISR